jgi:hypothetical protein
LLEAATERCANEKEKAESRKQKSKRESQFDFRFPAFSFRRRRSTSALWLDGRGDDARGNGYSRRFCRAASAQPLAFCLDESGRENTWLSIWSAVSRTFIKCRQRVVNLSGESERGIPEA